MTTPCKQYVALLRGINVGGHHKVPMAELKSMMHNLGFEDVKTLLNSGNVVFTVEHGTEASLEKTLSASLQSTFGFAVPSLVRNAETIQSIVTADPFKDVPVTKDIRLYVTFLNNTPGSANIPWESDDGSFRITGIQDNAVFSVLDLSKSKTVAAMKILEQSYGKDITTRNWNTVVKIAGLLK